MKLSPPLGHEPVAVCLGVRVAVAGENHLGSHGLDGLDLDLGCRLRHDDDGLEVEVSGGVGHTLGMVAGAGGDDSPGPLLGREVGNAVVGAPQLEAEDRLQILALEEDVLTQSAGEMGSSFERGLPGHVVDTAGQNVVQKGRVWRRIRHRSKGYDRSLGLSKSLGEGTGALSTG